MLWDLSTDYYLHHADPRDGRRRRSYTQWWTPAHLRRRTMPRLPQLPAHERAKPHSHFDDYWLEYYRPRAVSSIQKLFASGLNSTLSHISLKMTRDGSYDLSPFVVRSSAGAGAGAGAGTGAGAGAVATPSKKKTKPRRGVIEFPGFKEQAQVEEEDRQQRAARRGWLSHPLTSSLSPSPPPPPPPLLPPSDRAYSPAKLGCPPTTAAAGAAGAAGQAEIPVEMRNMHQAVERALNPTISAKERREYHEYMSHPLHLPLVVSSEPSARDLRSEVVREFVRYVDTVRCCTATAGTAPPLLDVSEQDRLVYAQGVRVPDNPLMVEELDGTKPRYQAYAQYLLTGRLKRGTKV